MFFTVYRGLYLPYARVYIIKYGDFFRGAMIEGTRKANPINVEYEMKAKNLLKGELKRRGISYAQLAEKLATLGISETERNLNNKISRGGFTAAFLLQCLEAIGANIVQVSS
jgi:hypothetical protein